MAHIRFTATGYADYGGNVRRSQKKRAVAE